MNNTEITQADIFRQLHYDYDTGGFIWLNPSKYHSEKALKPAGTLNDDGYIKIGLFGRSYFAHRLAWLYVHGHFPGDETDHINRIRHDNRIINLRLADRYLNTQNNCKKGGSRRLKSGRYDARITRNKKVIYLGTYATKEQAREILNDYS